MAASARRRSTLRGDAARDFSGGPNLRDSEPELKANEVEDAWNITFDERGGAASRLGYAKQNPTPFSGGAVVAQTWSSILGQRITQAGADLYLGDTNTSRHTFSTAAPCDFAEMNDLVIAVHEADGIFTSPDGITWTAVADLDAPANPICCEVWQTKLFVGDATGAVYWSAIGDPTAWAAADTNKLWEHDQEGIVALHVGSGQDIQGRPGLLAYKNESFYRIHDSTTGAYVTLSSTLGAASKKAVIGVGSRVCFVNKHGVYWWREGLAEPVNASDRLLPLWDPAQVNLSQLALWAAGRKGNRALFSVTRAGSTANDLALELHPDQGWIAPRSDAMSCYATSTGDAEALYGGSPTVSGQVYELATGGDDDGAAISGRLQTRWVELNGGFNASLWQLRLHGRGSGTVTVRTDYASAGGTDYPFDLTQNLIQYDTGLTYDSGLEYVSPAYQTSDAVDVNQACRQFSLLFTFSSSSTADAPQVLGSGTAPTVGYFGLSGFEWMFRPLGLS